MTIQEARAQVRMNRTQLSEWLEIPYRTLTNWENGARPCPAYIEKLIVEKILNSGREYLQNISEGESLEAKEN